MKCLQTAHTPVNSPDKTQCPTRREYTGDFPCVPFWSSPALQENHHLTSNLIFKHEDSKKLNLWYLHVRKPALLPSFEKLDLAHGAINSFCHLPDPIICIFIFKECYRKYITVPCFIVQFDNLCLLSEVLDHFYAIVHRIRLKSSILLFFLSHLFFVPFLLFSCLLLEYIFSSPLHILSY